MQTIGMFEAKTHLPEIIRDVQKGKIICLTNRNKAVAFIIPVEQHHKNKNESIFNKLAKLKKFSPIGDINEIISLRDEGRK